MAGQTVSELKRYISDNSELMFLGNNLTGNIASSTNTIVRIAVWHAECIPQLISYNYLRISSRIECIAFVDTFAFIVNILKLIIRG